MIYIDFDGVILDTEKLLFEEWRKNPNRHLLPESEKIKYIKNANWEYIIWNSEIINDSIYYLKHIDPSQSTILTKISSLENEGLSKIKWLRAKKVRQPIILTPSIAKKTDMVDPKNNILIDDCLTNLDEWKENLGIPIFFDIDNDNYDSYHIQNNKKYPKILSLSKFTKSKIKNKL